MPSIKIEGIPPFDGEYPLNLPFTYADFRDIKRISGVRASEVQEALSAGDLDVVVALASVALRRAGLNHDPEVLFSAPTPGGITFVGDEEEVEEADPPVSAEGTSSDGSNGASGTSTSPGTDTSPETLTPASSGIPQPDSTSVPATLTT